MNDVVLVIVATILMSIGFIGVILPVVPGVPYMFVIALLYGFIDTFEHLTPTELTTLGVVALSSIIIDYLSGMIGAKVGGASREGVRYGFIGLVIGTLIFPPLGSILGLFLGVLAGELSKRRSQQQAIKAATAGLIGSLTGIGINLILALVFVALFISYAI